jgi:hypothetical protein
MFVARWYEISFFENWLTAKFVFLRRNELLQLLFLSTFLSAALIINLYSLLTLQFFTTKPFACCCEGMAPRNIHTSRCWKEKNVLAIIKLGFRRQGAAAGRRSGPEESLALNVTACDPNMDSCLGSNESEINLCS